MWVNDVNIWARGVVFGLGMMVVAAAIILFLGVTLEQRAEQPDDAYVPPAVPKPYAADD